MVIGVAGADGTFRFVALRRELVARPGEILKVGVPSPLSRNTPPERFPALVVTTHGKILHSQAIEHGPALRDALARTNPMLVMPEAMWR